MENKVIMALSDYNALKRKADALEQLNQLVSLKIWDSFVEFRVDAKAIEPYVMAKVREAIERGELDESRLTVIDPRDWFGGITFASIDKKPKEAEDAE